MLILAGGSLNLLSVNPGLVFWTAVTFLSVLVVLWLFAWKPIINALDARNTKVEEDLDSSKKLREEAESLIARYQKELDSAKEKALQIVNEGHKDAESVRHRILEEAKTEAELIHKRALSDIEQAKTRALKEIEINVAEISYEILSRVLKNNVSAAEHKGIITKELEQIKKAS